MSEPSILAADLGRLGGLTEDQLFRQLDEPISLWDIPYTLSATLRPTKENAPLAPAMTMEFTKPAWNCDDPAEIPPTFSEGCFTWAAEGMTFSPTASPSDMSCFSRRGPPAWPRGHLVCCAVLKEPDPLNTPLAETGEVQHSTDTARTNVDRDFDSPETSTTKATQNPNRPDPPSGKAKTSDENGIIHSRCLTGIVPTRGFPTHQTLLGSMSDISYQECGQALVFVSLPSLGGQSTHRATMFTGSGFAVGQIIAANKLKLWHPNDRQLESILETDRVGISFYAEEVTRNDTEFTGRFRVTLSGSESVLRQLMGDTANESDVSGSV